MGRKLIFLLGGARSGKSHYAEQWAAEHGKNVLFVATAQAFDDEMRERIAHHRSTRPTHWHTLEEPLYVAEVINAALSTGKYDTVLLDCITLLASNLLLTLPEDCKQEDANQRILMEIDALLEVVAQSDLTWLVISNEVGMGVVPPSQLGRLYRDALGRANQRIALVSDEVLLLVAGLPWALK